MQNINIKLSEEDHRLLADEYKKMSISWLRNQPSVAPPPFEEWLAGRLTANVRQTAMSEHELQEMHTVNAIEKLITSLPHHSFGIAYLGKAGTDPAESAEELALALVNNLELSRTRVKRLQELLNYYSKSVKEIADQAHVGVTNRTYGALHEAYRELAERTAKVTGRLGEERALGRVEGAVAILVNLNVMTREVAKSKTEEFRQKAIEQQ